MDNAELEHDARVQQADVMQEVQDTAMYNQN